MKINVTKTFLPPQEEYNLILKKAWDINWITNRGVLVQELESKLKDYLKVSNIIATTNGTLPLQIAIKALGLTGEIITTPFSYVATTSSIVWEGCTPIFVDIHPEYLTIDETKIEAAITPNTSAILATHVFGNPCAVDEIEAIANKHNLKVIYDAAHCFGVTFKGQSLFNYGDISTCSFHATKLFHTGEGGAIFCKSKYFDLMYHHHNFGHQGPYSFRNLGINAKMSEVQAAMGLAVLPYLNKIISARKEIIETYKKKLPSFKSFRLRDEALWNYSYFPIICDNEHKLQLIEKALNDLKIYPRRYFYPSLEDLPYVSSNKCPIAKDISSRILCLPLSADLNKKDLNVIINCINKVI